MNDSTASAATAGSGLGRRLVRNTLHTASGRLASMAVWLVFTPAILRALGAEGFGVWALFYALTAYLSALDFGLVQGTLRNVAAARERGDHEEAGATATLAAVGFLLLGAVWLVATLVFSDPAIEWLRIPDAFRDEARWAALTAAGVFTLAGVANVTLSVLQGYGRFDLANRVILVVAAQQAIGFAIVLGRGLGLPGLVINVALGWAVAAAVGAVTLRTARLPFRWGPFRAGRSRLGEALRFGGPMQAAALLAAVNAHLDKFLLARLVSLAIVAPYELGLRVVTAAATLPQFLLLATMPEAAALHAARSPDRLRDLYVRGNRYLLTAAAVLVAAVLAAADRLFVAWLGPGHVEAALSLRWLAVTSWLSISTGMGTSIARGVGRTDLEAWAAGVAVVVHLALCLWWIPGWGLIGALAAGVAGLAVCVLAFQFMLARALAWNTRTIAVSLALPGIATIAGAAVGTAVDSLVPGWGGPSAWAALLVVGGSAASAAAAILVASGYLPWREARSLLARS